MKERISGIWKCFLLFFFLCLFLCLGKNVRAEEIQLYAHSAVLMDAKTGRVLYGKEEDVMRPMASTTKIMTCILALEKCSLDEIVTVSKYAQNQPKVHMGMQEGEKYYMEELLYSLMLESHNDSAVAIAEHVGESVEQFAKMMNEKAKEIGCEEVHFVTPNGLDGEREGKNHGITAKDLAKIMSYCILKSPKRNEFIRITQKQFCQIHELTGKREVSLRNHNALFQMMEGVISGKTGFTSKAGYCYVGAVENGGRIFVVSLLGSGWPNNRNYKWQDTKALIEYGVNHYHNIMIDTNELHKNIPVKKGIKNSVKGEVEGEQLEVLVKKGEKVQCKIETVKELEAPIKKGRIVGKAVYYLDNDIIKEYPVVISESIRSITFYDVYKQLFKEMILSCFLRNEKV